MAGRIAACLGDSGSGRGGRHHPAQSRAGTGASRRVLPDERAGSVGVAAHRRHGGRAGRSSDATRCQCRRLRNRLRVRDRTRACPARPRRAATRSGRSSPRRAIGASRRSRTPARLRIGPTAGDGLVPSRADRTAAVRCSNAGDDKRRPYEDGNRSRTPARPRTGPTVGDGLVPSRAPFAGVDPWRRRVKT